jgi:molybdopterin synthase catalytic subunit
MTDLKILSEPLDISACIKEAASPECGSTDIFIGTVRNQTNGKRVIRLEYEAYESMALKEMQKIADDVFERWEIKNILIHHRTGILHIGGIAVVIAVSTPHREAAFKASRYAIDTLKKTVPIWKKEVFEGGEEWVSAHA